MSTDEQRSSGAGIAAQRGAILAEAERRGWRVVEVVDDAGYSAKDLKRPGVHLALDALRRGNADALVVAKLDRLSRSMLDFASIMATASRQGWGVIALDCAVDTTTPAGEAMANVLASFAQFERRLIGQRTRDALAVKREQGVVLGRPRTLDGSTERRILAAHGAGASLSQIARDLEADSIPTARGGSRWHASTVRAIVQSRATPESVDA